ncbi:hypothetical protein OE88DRAFT_1638505, partial [Heliocybe sulcata]
EYAVSILVCMAMTVSRKYHNHRDRHNRVELRNIQWAEQYKDLVDAYLVYGLHEQDGLVPEVHHNATLIRHGFIGASPIRPSVAISIRTLAVYRQTHRACPQLSVQAEVRKLCHLHKFTIAYDVYLEILNRVDARIWSAMNQDGPNDQLLRLCPACTYKLRDEAPLPFSLHCEMDGNNSLKRIDAVVRERCEHMDTRQPRGPFWVSQEEVDCFKDEVKVCC